MNDKEQNIQSTQAIARVMSYLLWIVLAALGIAWYFKSVLNQQHNPNQLLATQLNSSGEQVVILERNAYGHYVSPGKINGMDVIFFLDTGATVVSIPERVARKLQLRRGAEVTVNTANGTTIAYITKIESIELGHIKLQNISAHINPSMDSDDILLGMSFLKHLEFSQKGKQLSLKEVL